MTDEERIFLSSARRRLGLSQVRLASMIPSRVGCKRSLTGTAINAFENGHRDPHPVTLAAWREALGSLK